MTNAAIDTMGFAASAFSIAPSNFTAAKVIVAVAATMTKKVISQSAPTCAQVNSFLSNTGHAGSVITLGAAGYTWWTGATVPYLTAAGIVSGVADLASVGLDHIPGCK
jgi:hypothetical protein